MNSFNTYLLKSLIYPNVLSEFQFFVIRLVAGQLQLLWKINCARFLFSVVGCNGLGSFQARS